MKTLFIGGIKSGKSAHAETYTLKNALTKPYYLATTEFFDLEMSKKVQHHKLHRGNSFHTIEEALDLHSVIKNKDSIVLVECISMWINNMLFHKNGEKEILEHIERIMLDKQSIVFVINDVSTTVVSENALVREFVNINGLVSQHLASQCDEVYNTVAGIAIKIK